jgi:hypothetical protein
MTEKIIKDLILQAPAGQEIFDQGMSIIIMLLEKNISYGNSALSPLSIFSNNNAGEQLDVRIDDKLNRIKNNKSFVGDNDLDDLIGYLILKKVYNAKKPVYNGNWDPEATDQLK